MEKRFHCQHCNKKISKTLYYQHKKGYYSSATSSWVTHDDETGKTSASHTSCEDQSDFTFSDSSSSNEDLGKPYH